MSASRQRGFLLPALALLLLVGGLTLGVALHHRVTNTRIHLQSVTADNLGQARALLRDFAQNYGLTHSKQTPGYLPCPDMDGDGSAETDCPTAGDMAVGLFPYRTLGHAPLRDGYGECLWYAVAGTFKDNPKKPAPALMNWDTPGQISVVTTDGRRQFPITRPTSLAAAVVIAPGPALSTQSRPDHPGQPCIAPGTTAAYAPLYLESSFGFPGSTMIDILTESADDTVTNDQVAWVLPGHIFEPTLFQRPAFRDEVIGRMFDEARAQFAAFDTSMLPPPEGPLRIGDVELGRLPSLLTSDSSTPYAYLFREWQDQYRYLRCVASVTDRCMQTLDGTTCRGILLFSGMALSTQDRARGFDADYFESNTDALLFPETSPFVGTGVFSPDAPQRDLLLCL